MVGGAWKKDVLQRYEASSATYVELYSEEQDRKYDLALFLVPVHEEDLVLDVGCGPGAFLKRLGPGPIVVGVDFSTSQINQANAMSHGSNLVMADAERLPFVNGTFDRVFSFSVLQNLETPNPAFSEIRRVMKHEGKFCFTVLDSKFPVGQLISDAKSSGFQVEMNVPVQNTRDRLYLMKPIS